MKEAFFSPRDAETLQALFNAFSKAAELNPGDGDDDDDDDDNGGEGDEEEREGGGGGGLFFDQDRWVYPYICLFVFSSSFFKDNRRLYMIIAHGQNRNRFAMGFLFQLKKYRRRRFAIGSIWSDFPGRR